MVNDSNTRISNRTSKCSICHSYIHAGDRIAFVTPAPRIRARVAVHARHVDLDTARYRKARRENEAI